MAGGPNVKKVESPNPNWKPGQKQSHPFPDNETIELVPDKLGAAGMYPFIISSCVPRPIAFICSLSAKVCPLPTTSLPWDLSTHKVR